MDLRKLPAGPVNCLSGGKKTKQLAAKLGCEKKLIPLKAALAVTVKESADGIGLAARPRGAHHTGLHKPLSLSEMDPRSGSTELQPHRHQASPPASPLIDTASELFVSIPTYPITLYFTTKLVTGGGVLLLK